MNNIENYFLIATISSVVLYAVYYLFLRKESFHQFNRFYLLSAMMLSLSIPLIQLPVQSIPNSASPVVGFITSFQLTELIVYAQNNTSSINIANWFGIFYMAGILIFTFMFFVKIIKISLLIIKSEKRRMGKYTYIAYEAHRAPFSFFNYIFINSDAYNEEDAERIMLHEQIHVRQRHSWDLIFLELVSILLWFNPILLLYKRSLQVIHEYLADHWVLQQGFEQGAYLNLLLLQLILPNEWMIGHHFNYLLTKNRFKMLKNNHYSKWAIAKFAFALPFIALLLMLNCKHKTEETQFTNSDVVAFEAESVTTVEDLPAVETEITDDEPPIRFAEEMPEFEGGTDAMFKFLQETLKYPVEAKQKGISGQVFIEFVVAKDGSVTHVKVIRSADPELDAEAVRAVKAMPKWKPGKMRGVPVPCYFNIPVRFTIN
jgi:TonB family protein